MVAKIVPLLIAASVLIQTPPDARVRGVVIDGTGKPLAGVSVVSLPWGSATTDSDGRFEIERPSERVRFSLHGFTPVTRAWNKAHGATVLTATSDSPLRFEYCRENVQGEFYDVGRMRLGPISEADVVPNVDDDYVSAFIRYRGGQLTIGQGLHWSDGLPLRGELEALRHFVERDVVAPFMDDVAAEYTGVEEAGTAWRFVGHFGWTISYTGADVEAAAVFDRLIDGMCWVHE